VLSPRPSWELAGPARAVAASGLVAAFLYSDWVFLQPTVGAHLSAAHSYISEMGAMSQPDHVLVNALDVLCGLCTVLCALLLRRLLPSTVLARLGITALVVFGVATALGGVWPMTCTPSVDATCAAGGLALGAPWRDLLTTALSVVANGALPVSMALFALALAGTPGWRHVAWAGRVLLLVTVPLTVAVALLALLTGDVGLPQRVLVVLQSVWVATLAVTAVTGQWAARRTVTDRLPQGAERS
jgi:hypothetical membrane protein